MGNDFLQIILYVLGAVLLSALIVLVIKLIYSINHINNILENVEGKIRTLDKAFASIDRVVDSFSAISDRLVDKVTSLVGKLFSHKKKPKNIKNRNEEDW